MNGASEDVIEAVLRSPKRRAELLERVRGFLTDARAARLEQALEQRTRLVTVALEDVYQGHNASAILRSCEGFGIQDVHVVEARHRFKANDEIALGAAQWLTLLRHRSPLALIAALRAEGRRIVATVADETAPRLEDLALDRPLALCFGTELEGLSAELRGAADLHARIPMFGLTRSFNVSVSVAVCLYELLRRVRALPYDHWRLGEEERQTLFLRWILRAHEPARRVAAQFTVD